MIAAVGSSVSGRDRTRLPCCKFGVARQRGLTIVELVLVIVIIGVLGALAGPRFFGNRAFDERRYAEEVASMLRYAQKVAVGSGCRVRVELASGSYNLTQQAASAGHCDPSDTTFPSPVVLSTGETASGTPPSGVALSAPLVVVFDALGQTTLGADQAIGIGPHTLILQAGSGLLTGP